MDITSIAQKSTPKIWMVGGCGTDQLFQANNNCFNPFPTFQSFNKGFFKYFVGKKENAGKQHFYPFLLPFIHESYLSVNCYARNLSSAYVFNFDSLKRYRLVKL